MLPEKIYKYAEPIDFLYFQLRAVPSWSEDRGRDLMEPIPFMAESLTIMEKCACIFILINYGWIREYES